MINAPHTTANPYRLMKIGLNATQIMAVDYGYKVGDIIHLTEIASVSGSIVKNMEEKTVKNILKGDGIPDSNCILQFE